VEEDDQEVFPLARHRRCRASRLVGKRLATSAPLARSDRDAALLFLRPDRDFPYFGKVKPYLKKDWSSLTSTGKREEQSG
jgi:hypothetical protein